MCSNFHNPPSIHPSSNSTLMKRYPPSMSSIKKYKIELELDQPLNESSYGQKVSHLYRPGDLINGELVLTPPSCSKHNDVQFNEISIQLECKLINNTVGGPGGTKVLLKMEDNPPINSNTSIIATTRFPFSFKLPETLLDNTCSQNIELHKSLPPSFASPKICGMVFSADKNAGSVPYHCEQYQVYKDLMFQKFCVVYYISATISQRTSHIDKPFVLFKRVLDIPVQNELEIVPTNLTKTSYDIASYYGINDITHDHELVLTKSTGLKKDLISIGYLTSSILIPSPISLSSPQTNMTIPVSLKFKSTIAPISIPNLNFSAQLTQYVVQSSSCLPPTAKPTTLPDDYKVEKECSIRKITQKVQSIPCPIKMPMNDDPDLWIPDYEDENTLLKRIMIQIPYLNEFKLQPTFHTCTLQNVYVLQLKVFHQDYEAPPQMIRKGSSGSLLEKIGFTSKKNGDSALDDVHEVLKLDIPLTVLS